LPPSKQSRVSEDEWICRFIVVGEWDEELEQPTPSAFRASDRQLSAFHPKSVEQLGSKLRDLCIERLDGAGEAHLQVEICIELGRCISNEFRPNVYWRPDKVAKPWERWKAAHTQIESQGGNSNFPQSYRSLLAENATCLRPPDDL
jgi:hypothetical protein